MPNLWARSIAVLANLVMNLTVTIPADPYYADSKDLSKNHS
jgi:hypothetical protein